MEQNDIAFLASVREDLRDLLFYLVIPISTIVAITSQQFFFHSGKAIKYKSAGIYTFYEKIMPVITLSSISKYALLSLLIFAPVIMLGIMYYCARKMAESATGSLIRKKELFWRITLYAAALITSLLSLIELCASFGILKTYFVLIIPFLAFAMLAPYIILKNSISFLPSAPSLDANLINRRMLP